MTVVAARRIVDGRGHDGPGWLDVVDGRVVERGTGATPGRADTTVDALVPGFVDAHVHGACGIDFAAAGTDPGPAIAHHHRAGSTALVASLATGPLDTTLTRLRELAPFVRDGALAGLHLEGPFLSSARRGAHDPALLRSPDAVDVDMLLSAADGALATVTLAPELPGALDAVRRFTDAGVAVALGHTGASAEIVGDAVDAGARVLTHVFNGMPPLHHREPGPVGVGLADARLALELIGDGHHVADIAIDAVRRAARGRTMLVSDAMAATGLGDGRYRVAGSDVVVVDGVATLADGSSLAGATAVVGDAVERLLARGVDLAEVVALTRTAPVRALRMPNEALAPGAPADLVSFEGPRISRVMRRGEWLASSS
ncbi:amidohydrolase family protein [Microbacterium betulae]|uniref:Amidohydrolase family protein n=1 Tax=Microbacterium betulae TaxID=2981139 RepID=A0AA97FKH7_9MICO|nr:amidohydrolase family protein [Microbacterium sp. AB]WOF23152.1 amidohydrolase family protein [Microbacterium sp. AB]